MTAAREPSGCPNTMKNVALSFPDPARGGHACGQMGDVAESLRACGRRLVRLTELLGRGARGMIRRRLDADRDIARGRCFALRLPSDAVRRPSISRSSAQSGNLIDRFRWRPTLDRCEISSVAREVDWPAPSLRDATTANPLPASPARAASMVALSASKLVCDAMVEMMLTIEPMRSAVLFSDWMACCARCVSPTAALAISRPRVASWPICWIDPDSSSVAWLVLITRCAVSDAAFDATAMRLSVSSATSRMVEHVAVSDVEASVTALSTSPMALPKSAMASSIAVRRTCAAFVAASRCSVIAFATSNAIACDSSLVLSASSAGREAVLAGKRVDRRPQHVVSGGAAQAGVKAERGFLLDGFPARSKIGGAEVPVEQRLPSATARAA